MSKYFYVIPKVNAHDEIIGGLNDIRALFLK